MLLAETGINEFVEKLRNKHVYLDQLQIKYNPDNKKPYAKLHCYGMEDIHQDESYYENILEHLIAANLSWLDPISKAIKAPLEAEIAIDEDGNFDNQTIKAKMEIYAPSKIDAVIPFLYNRIKPFVLLNELVDSVEVHGYQGKLRFVRFNMTIDTFKVNPLLKKERVNRAILEQWLASINNYVMENSHQDHFENKFYVVNGKINMEYKLELIDQYFALPKTK